MVTSSKTSSSHAGWSRSSAARVPVPAAGHCRPVPLQETLKHWKASLTQSLWGLWVLVCTRFYLSPLSISGGLGFDSQLDFALPTILLGLLLYPWTWTIFFWWDPTFSCWWLFSCKLQFWNSLRKRWAHVLLLCHLVKSIEYMLRKHYFDLDAKRKISPYLSNKLLECYQFLMLLSPYHSIQSNLFSIPTNIALG